MIVTYQVFVPDDLFILNGSQGGGLSADALSTTYTYSDLLYSVISHITLGLFWDCWDAPDHHFILLFCSTEHMDIHISIFYSL